MKVKKGFILRDIGTRKVVIATGSASQNFNGIVRLNESAELLWRLLERGTTEEELTRTLIREYDVDRETAQSDVSMFITKLRGAGIIGD